jgi:DNA polymerase-3 subunit gamma/tau
VKFIFATTEIRKVPVTVLSRCQRFDLRRISVVQLAAYFGKVAANEGISIAPAALDLIARAADGSARDGMSLLDQAIAQSSGDGAEGTITGPAVADMLGLADRGAVFDLMEAVLAGKPADALAITDRAYERGADLGLLLGDLLDLTHTLTRLKTIPGLKTGPELPEAERTRGGALADKLTIPVLGRLWQMLLKGVGEVETAPDRRQAAEMVLIRLCHVADLPPPGELVKRLTAEAAAAAPPPSAPRSGWDGPRAVVNAPMPMASAAPDPQAEAPPALRLAHFRDVAALVAERREATLHGHLVHSVHLVRFAPGVIELRPEPEAPRDLAPRLAALLLEATGTRWTIALSPAPGEPTLAQQAATADAARRAAASDHPLVRAILEAFPGARIDSLRDERADAYGLVDPTPEINPDMPDFAPPDAVPADDTEYDE